MFFLKTLFKCLKSVLVNGHEITGWHFFTSVDEYICRSPSKCNTGHDKKVKISSKNITEIVIFQNFAMCVQAKYGLNSSYNLYFYIGEKFVHNRGMLKLFVGI